jgi:hypothetical protein
LHAKFFLEREVKFFLAPKNIILYIIFFSGMPNITVKKKLFLREIDEENYSTFPLFGLILSLLLFFNLGDEDVELLCFNFGIEVDEITSDRKEAEKERGFSEELYKFSDEVSLHFHICWLSKKRYFTLE